MRRLYLLCLLLPLLVGLAACSSNDFYRGHVETSGTASAQAFHVRDGVPESITNKYTLTGQGAATVQTVKPYLTLDGAWQADQTPGAARAEEPGAVLMRPAPPSASPYPVVKYNGQPAMLVPLTPTPAAPGVGDCPSGSCTIPLAKQYVGMTSAWDEAPCAPAAPAAPLPQAVSDGCGLPVYKGCDGTPGGHPVNNPSTTPKAVAPGTGWPCGANQPPSVVGALAVPPGFLIHAGGCLVEAVRCTFSYP